MVGPGSTWGNAAGGDDRGGLRRRTEDEWTFVVARHGEQIALRRADALDVARLSPDEESAPRRVHRSECPLPVAAQHRAVAAAHPSDLRLEAVEVAREQQVHMTVP